MPILYAVGTSLAVVFLLGLSATGSYAVVGLVNWQLAAWFIMGGAGGSLIGTALAKRVGNGAGSRLKLIFAAAILITAIYVICRAL